MKNLKCSEIKDYFEKFDCTFKCIAKNEEKNIRVYLRTFKDYPNLKYFEIISPRPFEKEDGSIVYRYPSTSEFGQYGLCINAKSIDADLKTVFYLNNGLSVRYNRG